MKKLLFLNVFYNLVIMASIVGAVSAYENKSPLISIFLAAVVAAILYFKFKLRKQIKETLTNGPSPKENK
jgi:hypothetical protein